MSTLIAVKLQLELEITRRAMVVGTERPSLVCRWVVDAASGRPVAVWTQRRDAGDPILLAEPASP